MPTVCLIEGPVGAGKSTFGARLSAERGAVRFCLDEWMRDLFRPDRPETDVIAWYLARKQRCLAQILDVAGDVVDRGLDVVLELGLVSRAERWAFYERMDAEARPVEVYVLDAPREVRLARVRARNADKGPTHHAFIPDEIFALADAAWEEPDAEELRARDIRHR